MDNDIRNTDPYHIDFRGFFLQIAKKKFTVLLVILAFVLLSFLYTKFLCTPKYTSNVKLYVSNSDSETISTSDFSIASYLSLDYKELITDRAVLEEVIKKLNLDYNYGALKGCISVEIPNNTRTIIINVTTDDAKKSKLIADTVCDVAEDKMTEIMRVDYITPYGQANLPLSPSSPNLRSNVFYGFLIGIFFAVAIVFASYFLNDKINSEEDVEKFLGLTALGVIPYNDGRGKHYESYRRTAGAKYAKR